MYGGKVMALSMTGFARTEVALPSGRLSLEIRSVNHRYLDVTVRLPDQLRFAEPLIREHLRDQVSRGKVDVNVRWRSDDDSMEAQPLDVRADRLEALQRAIQQVRRVVPESVAPDALSVLNWPGVLVQPELQESELTAAVKTATQEALDQLTANRQREGEALAAQIERRLNEVAAVVTELRQAVPSLQQHLLQRLQERLATLQANAVDPERLAQEVAMLAQKADVAEELDRLDAHVAEARQVLGRQEPVGRRLDFLMQEFNREANTLGSKAAQTDYTQAAIDLKVHIEQMREQIQNLE